MNQNIKPGQLYKHYKGDTYKILTVAKSTETEEWLVVYERQTNIAHTGWGLWVRPMAMFMEDVDVEGYKGPRFEYIGE
jgi:hypothetical protein